jgi:hypothetical protein
VALYCCDEKSSKLFRVSDLGRSRLILCARLGRRDSPRRPFPNWLHASALARRTIDGSVAGTRHRVFCDGLVAGQEPRLSIMVSRHDYGLAESHGDCGARGFFGIILRLCCSENNPEHRDKE